MVHIRACHPCSELATNVPQGCIYNQRSALQNAYKAGHQIASHTWTHPHVGSLSASALTTEMTKLETALVNIIGMFELFS